MCAKVKNRSIEDKLKAIEQEITDGENKLSYLKDERDTKIKKIKEDYLNETKKISSNIKKLRSEKEKLETIVDLKKAEKFLHKIKNANMTIEDIEATIFGN